MYLVNSDTTVLVVLKTTQTMLSLAKQKTRMKRKTKGKVFICAISSMSEHVKLLPNRAKLLTLVQKHKKDITFPLIQYGNA